MVVPAATSPPLLAMAPSDALNPWDLLAARGVLMIFFFASLSLVFLLVLSTVLYTYGKVVATLAIAEATQPSSSTDAALAARDTPPAYQDDPTATEPAPAPAPAVSPIAEASEELASESTPLTVSLRRTLRHLRARGGLLARFRGLHLYLLLEGLVGSLTSIATGIFGANIVVASLALVVAHGLLAKLHLLWTHTVVSAPSSRWALRRLAGRRAWRKILPPTLLWASVQALFQLPPWALVRFLWLPMFEYLSHAPPEELWIHVAPLMGILLCLAGVVLGMWVLTMPVQVLLVRCQVALLPADEEPLVRVDRSWDGRVVLEAEGGAGYLGLRDAWKSVSVADWKRIAWVYVKTSGLLMLVFGKFSLLLGLLYVTLLVKPAGM